VRYLAVAPRFLPKHDGFVTSQLMVVVVVVVVINVMLCISRSALSKDQQASQEVLAVTRALPFASCSTKARQ